jgi:predicted nucleic acid-binding protein
VDVIVDTSVWIELLAGRESPDAERALADGAVVIPPLVVAELVSGASTPAGRQAVGELLQELPVHEAPLEHWIRVGDLRRTLGGKGVNATVPDAHIAQCALDRDAILLSRDAIFAKIARYTRLRLGR